MTLAYPTGFPLTLRHYYTRIRTILARMDAASQRAHPCNRALVDRFAGCVPLREVDAVLAGVRTTQTEETWDAELFARFAPYVAHEERRTKRMLESLLYYLDAPDTVAMVLGSGRAEKVRVCVPVSMRRSCGHLTEIVATDISVTGESIADHRCRGKIRTAEKRVAGIGRINEEHTLSY